MAVVPRARRPGATRGRRAGLAVQPRELSFTAARHATVATTRTGTATASLTHSLILDRYQQASTISAAATPSTATDTATTSPPDRSPPPAPP